MPKYLNDSSSSRTLDPAGNPATLRHLLAFYLTGMARAVDTLGPGDDAPLLAKSIAGTSLFLWIGVVVCGRLIPRGL